MVIRYRLSLLCLLLLSFTPTSLSQAPRAHHWGTERIRERMDPVCKQKCDQIENNLKPKDACNRYRRTKPTPTVGATCDDAFFRSFRHICVQACEEKGEYRPPRVPKCTGLGSQIMLVACEAGWEDGKRQTFEGLGLGSAGEEVEDGTEREGGAKKGSGEENGARLVAFFWVWDGVG